MRETKNYEVKERISNTFLKTVSAFANYGTGDIKFGIKDNGEQVGIGDVENACLDIENKINDSIKPSVDYTLSIDNKTNVITLHVIEGIHKPYLYNGKAYKRNDSSTIEVDHLELTRLILEGKNLSFEELDAKEQNLKFDNLNNRLKEQLKLDDITKDTYITLGLINKNGNYNNAGELLADDNGFPGIEIVRFGSTINTILDRVTLINESVLTQYDKANDLFEKYYQFEQINGSKRESVYLIPKEAFREAIANALVHRTWDLNANITVFMFEDRIEITSPGGLTSGVREEDYLKGGISILRNPIVGGLFLRFDMMEKLGTGIRRINEEYRDYDKKPIFDISDDAIRIMLPVYAVGGLSKDENTVYQLLRNKSLASSSIIESTGFGKTKTVEILNKLVNAGYVKAIGNGRGKKYTS